MASPNDMDGWAITLSQRFFHRDQAGQPVIFSVDAVNLGEISGLGQDEAVKSLTRAVKSSLGREGPDLFKPIVDRSLDWKLRGDKENPPPFLPLLALTVLAASRMRAEGNMSAANYYGRFKALLDLTQPVNAAYEDIPMLWKLLLWWLDDYHNGSHGRSTAREHPHWTNIGWALSQALFRDSDKQRLTHFFQWIDFEPGDAVDSAELLAFFRVWVNRGRVSEGAQLMARDESYEPQLRAILDAAAATWDGTLRDERGRRMGRILLTLEFPRKQLSFAAQRPEGFPTSGLFVTATGVELMLSSTFPGWYDEFPVAVNSEVLSTGLEAASADWSLAYKGGDVIPFRQNEELDAWASVRRVTPMAQHWVLVNRRVERSVRDYLQAAVNEFSAEPLWEFVDDQVLPGWVLLKNVVFSTRPSIKPEAALDRLVPQVKERPTLWGGLPLDSQTHVYLLGGEPDLWLPPAPIGAQHLEVEIDGTTERLGVAGGVIELRALRLDQGSHLIRVGPSSMTFHTISTTGTHAPTGTGARRHIMRTAGGQLSPTSIGATAVSPGSDEISICGAAIEANESELPSTSPPTLLPLGATECILLGAAPGDWLAARRPRDPKWLTEANLYPFGWEVQPTFEPVWVSHLRGGIWSTRMRTETPPLIEEAKPSDREAKSAWRKFIQMLPPPTGDMAIRLWDEYCRRAESPDE